MCLSAKSLFRAAALCLAALLTAAPALAQEKPSVAILEPEEEAGSLKLDAIVKAIIWGAVNEGLVSTGRYRFLDRSRVRETMAELSNTRNFDIYDQAGRKEFQKRLAADLVCITKVMKGGRGINVSVDILNVETGVIEHSVSDYKSTNDEEEIKRMVKVLAARIIPRAAAPAPTLPQAAPAPGGQPQAAAPAGQGTDDVVGYWERYGRLDSSNRTVVNGRLYRIVNTGLDHFFVARDDDEKWKKFQPGGNALSIFVTPKEDVYVVGNGYQSGGGILWKNGRREPFGEPREVGGARFETVFVSGFDVYVAGKDFPSAEMREDGPNVRDKRRVRALVLNGKVIKDKG